MSVEIAAAKQERRARDLALRFAAAAEDAAGAVVPPQDGENEVVVVMWAPAPRL